MSHIKWINGLSDAQVKALACQHGYKKWDSEPVKVRSWLHNQKSVKKVWQSIQSSETNQKKESDVG